MVTNFCRTLEISLINCEVTHILTWSGICFIDAPIANNYQNLPK